MARYYTVHGDGDAQKDNFFKTELEQCAQLFSKYYATWSKTVRMTADMLRREHLSKTTCVVTATNGHGQVIGHIFLVVHAAHRRQGHATHLCRLAFERDKDPTDPTANHIYGIVTSNPYAIRAMERAANVRCDDPHRIRRMLPALIAAADIPYIRRAVIIDYRDGACLLHTNFHIHAAHVQAPTSEDGWTLGRWRAGTEFAAFAFRDKPDTRGLVLFFLFLGVLLIYCFYKSRAEWALMDTAESKAKRARAHALLEKFMTKEEKERCKRLVFEDPPRPPAKKKQELVIKLEKFKCATCERMYSPLCEGANLAYGCCIRAGTDGYMYADYDGTKHDHDLMGAKSTTLQILNASKFQPAGGGAHATNQYYCDTCIDSWIQSGDVKHLGEAHFFCHTCGRLTPFNEHGAAYPKWLCQSCTTS